MEVTDFDGSLLIQEENMFLRAFPDGYIHFGEEGNFWAETMYLDYAVAYLLYRMLERSLLFLSQKK